MKVLEEGKWKMKWEMEATCREERCGARLLIEESDVHPVDYGFGFYATCEICGTKFKIPEKDVPLRLRLKLESKRKYSSSD